MGWLLKVREDPFQALERMRKIGWYQAYYSVVGVESIKSGSPLDELLEGGIVLGSVVDVFGENGVGKTQLSFQLCVEAARRTVEERDPRPSLFVDTCGTFRPERLEEIAKARGVKGALEHVMVKEVRSIEEQGGLLDELSERTGLFQLVVLDTVSENFSIGRMDLGERAEFSRQLIELGSMALKGRTAVLMTNTVRVRLDTGELVETAERIMSQNVHVRIRMSKANGLRATLVEPDLGMEVEYSVEKEGIASVF